MSVRRRDLRSSLRTVTIAWMFGIVWMACISGSQMTLFCRMLGFTNRDFGILAAIPWAATLAQLVASVAIERTGLRKYPVIFYASAHRLLWLAIALVPFVLNPGRGAVVMFMTIFGTSCVLAHMSVPRWHMWMSDLIPRRIRGRYFAARSLWTLPIQVVVVIAAGILLDRAVISDAPMTVQAQPVLLWTICGIFAVAAVFGAVDSLLHLRIREIVSPALADHPLVRRKGSLLAGISKSLIEPVRIIVGSFRDRNFRHYAIYCATITFSMTVSGQFFWLNALENIGYSKLGANIVFLVCGAVSSLLMVRLWGRLVDRWGRRPILILATVGVVFIPILWLLIPSARAVPGHMSLALPSGFPAVKISVHILLAYIIGAASCMLGGALWAGVTLAQTGIVLGFSETAGKSKYMAAAAVAAASGGFAGGLTGGEIAEFFEYLQKKPICFGPFQWINYHMTFLAALAGRVAAIFCLIGMPDPGAKSFRDVVRQMRFNAYNNVMTRMFWRIRTSGFRRKRHNHTGEGKDTDQSA